MAILGRFGPIRPLSKLRFAKPLNALRSLPLYMSTRPWLPVINEVKRR